jgi:uncharacterized protein YybS (DUF2232 family)
MLFMIYLYFIVNIPIRSLILHLENLLKNKDLIISEVFSLIIGTLLKIFLYIIIFLNLIDLFFAKLAK